MKGIISSLFHPPKEISYPKVAGLCLFVSKQFQVLFHWVSHPSFHLSLTVLVHYRSSEVFSLGGWSPQIPKGVCRLPWYSGTSRMVFEFRVHGFHVLWRPIPRPSAILRPPLMGVLQPPALLRGLGSARFARRLLRASTSISLPHPTKIFQFGWFPARAVTRAHPAYTGWGFPIRTPSDHSFLATPRRLSRPARPSSASDA